MGGRERLKEESNFTGGGEERTRGRERGKEEWKTRHISMRKLLNK